MNLPDIRLRIEELRRLIKHYNEGYFQKDAPEISDAAYDALMQELVYLEQHHPEFAEPDSPTQKVGAPPTGPLATQAHLSPMLSLGNAFSEADIIAFEERVKRFLNSQEHIDYVLEPKLDGVAVNLIYRDGRLTAALTRGDGNVGEDITANILTIPAVPRQIASGPPPPAVMEVRGEVIFLRADFLRLNQNRQAKNEPFFANPRNAAAGSLRQLDPAITASRPLDVYFYALATPSPLPYPTQADILATLAAWGFKVNPWLKKADGIGEVINLYRLLQEERSHLPYDIDGMVIKVSSLALQRALGHSAKAPRWALAAKFSASQGETKVEDIQVSVGRTGTLTPIALLQPLSLGGVTVSRASLHNEDEVARKDIRIGDWVIVERAGDVIPEIVSSLPLRRNGKERIFVMPDFCPQCASPASRRQTEAARRCENFSCPAQVKQRLEHFVSRPALDIDGLGETLISQFIDRGLVHDPADLFHLTYDDLISLDRIAAKSATNILTAIGGAKNPPLSKFIYALGIRHTGQQAALLLAKEFGTLERLMAASREDFLAIKGIGPEAAESLFLFFRDPANVTTLSKLKDAGVIPRAAALLSPQESPLAGKNFLFTGTLGSLTREDAKKLVLARGGQVRESVSKDLHYLVCGEKPGSKLDKAKKLGITVLTEEMFIKLLEETA